MEITHELMLDLQQTGVRQTIYAKRGDSMTRTAKIRLFDGGTEFTVPSGTILQIAYAKSDGKGGLYDTMPDKSSACAASGNIVTAKLHPQMFTVAGLVACELRILTGSGEQLSTFTWFIAVQSSATDGIKSEDYYNFATLDGVKNDIGDMSKLNTSVKDSLVAAINSVYSTVDPISKRYISGVNGKQRDASGNVNITGADVETQISAIGYQGSVEGAFEILEKMHGIPIARGSSSDGIAYTATGDDLPVVIAYTRMGKGRQIVFIPKRKNKSNALTLQLNDGEVIPIRLRAPQNQGDDDSSPDATLPVPTGALMCGVPYTLTFCGKYWLVDSQVTQFTGSVAAMLTKYADNLIGLTDGAGVTFPVVNADGGVSDEIAMATVERTETEAEAAEGSVKIPTTNKVLDLIRKDITADYDAWVPESGVGKTVENYAKTLPDGSYRIADDTIGRYEIEVFTVMNGQQWRILREHDDQFCYIIFYCGETLSILIDTETCDVQVGGRKMLTDWNIPLPTAADVGKVLMASAVNCAAWTEVENAEEVAV